MSKDRRHKFDEFVRRPLLWFFLNVVSLAVAVVVKFSAGFKISSDENALVELFINALVGTLVSFVFYFLVVHIPEKQRRNRFRRSFLDTYLSIKQDLLWQIVFASRKGGRLDLDTSHDHIEQLMDVRAFRAAFQGGRQANEGWFAFANHMSDDSLEFQEIIFLLQQLRMQVDYILLQDVFEDQKLLDFFVWLKQHLLRLERTDAGDWDKKPLLQFLYQLLSGWSFIEGYRDYDYLEREAAKIV